VFPLYEIIDGRLTLNIKMDERKPVIEYLKPQGRFRHLKPEDIEVIQRQVDEYYESLVYRSQCDANM
jgi:pyruvate ferredoxin oxidoreductase beta subunit